MARNRDGEALGLGGAEPVVVDSTEPRHSFEKLVTCPRGFMALAIDPKTLKDMLLAESPAIPTFSNATVVLTFDKQFWIGTFSGDQIAHSRLR